MARLRPVDDDSFRVDIRRAIEALASRPGHLSTRVAQALDDPSAWVLVSEWADVGSYRRALSSHDVKMASGVLMGAAVNEPSAYDVMESVGSDSA